MVKTSKRSGERGSVFLVLGAWLTLMLVLGMAVDYGIVLRYRRAMQNSCDAGALAGAANLKSDPTTAAGIAERYATQDMTQNNISSNAPTAVTLDSNSQPTLIKPDRVRLDIEATVPTYFYRLVRNSFDVKVECTAKIEPVTNVNGLVPVGLDYSKWVSYNNTALKGQTCDITIPISERPAACQTLTDMETLLGGWGNGNAGLLCLTTPASSNCGASEWNNEFVNGTSGFYCGDPNQVTAVPDPNGPACSTAQTKPGWDNGQVKAAVDARCAFPAPPASQERILIVPLINPSSAGAGRNTVQIWGFAAFELACPQNAGKSITGSFVSLVSYQATGCDPATNQNCVDTGVETVRLVQ